MTGSKQRKTLMLSGRKPGLRALTKDVRISSALDPTLFVGLAGIGDERFPLTVATADNITLTVMLSAKSVRNVATIIEQRGVGNVTVRLSGRLAPNGAVLEAGLAAQPKAPARAS